MARRVLSYVLLLFCLCAVAIAQLPTQNAGGPILSVRLYLRQSPAVPAGFFVQLYSSLGLLVAQARSDSSGVINFGVVAFGRYELRVSGEGIEPTTEQFEITSAESMKMVTVELRPSERESRGAQANAGILDASVPPKARKEMQKAVSATNDHNWEKARAHYQAAVTLYPKYAQAYYGLGLVYLELKESDKARNALQRAVDLKPGNEAASIRLARLDNGENKFDHAEQVLLKVIEGHPTNAEALFLLANAQRELQQYPAAIENARKVHALPHRGFEAAHLVCGLALEAVGQPDQAAEEYRAFLREAPSSPMAARAQSALETLSQPKLVQGPAQPLAAVNADQQSRDFSILFPSALLNPTWLPAAAIAVAQPPIADSGCPLAQVLHETGLRAKRFVNDLQQFTANEHVEHSEYQGKQWHRRRTITFEYVAEIHAQDSGALQVNEYRNGVANMFDVPLKLLTTGMAAMALIFYPNYADNFSFTCTGQTSALGEPAWQLEFAQRPAISSNFRGYWVAGSYHPIKLKGRAWIAARTFDVLRIDTELAEPIKDLLQKENMSVQYRSVNFAKRKTELRLPETAEIDIELRGHSYHDRYSYSDFQLFSVDTAEQTHLPETDSGTNQRNQ